MSSKVKVSYLVLGRAELERGKSKKGGQASCEVCGDGEKVVQK